MVIPAGAIDPQSKIWRTKSGNYLFREASLAKVFRGKWFQAMKEQGWKVKANIPKEWVVDCKRVGNGDKALTYLGRYLYRGVVREKDILCCQGGQVISLPTTLGYCLTMRLYSESKITTSLHPNPNCFRSGKAIALSIEETTKA